MPASEVSYEFERGAEPSVVMTNFSPPEDGFIWSTGSWCQIEFDGPPPPSGSKRGEPALTALDLALDLDVFKSVPDLEGQNVLFYVNGLRLASRFISRRVTVMLEVPAAFVRPAANTITIDTPDAARPADLGGSDTRRLGIQLFTLKVTAE